MATATLNFLSDALGTPQTVNLILPPPEQMPSASVLYLLHGLLDDQEAWLQRTRLVDYAERYNLVVVMPYAARSFYANQLSGLAWQDWIARELPAKIEQWLNLSVSKERRHIAGLSMGGYGAIKIGLSNPYDFASAGSFSGVLDLESVKETESYDMVKPDVAVAFGRLENIRGSEHDLMHLLTLHDDPPELFIRCGTEDSLIAGNRRIASHLENNGIDFLYHEQPGGHTWSLWDKDIDAYLDWLHKLGLLSLLAQ
jgi:S-formylglutathione hydrolase FrmB